MPETFTEICDGLSKPQISYMLRERLVPLNGHQYADAAPWRPRLGLNSRIVAQIPAAQFSQTIWKRYSKLLAAEAAQRLRVKAPRLSAHRRMTVPQALVFLALVAGVGFLFHTAPLDTAVHGLCQFFSLIFILMAWIRMLALTAPVGRRRSAAEMDDAKLPVYSVLVPLYKEANILPQLVRALSELSYPADKLDIKIILEEKDVPTRKAAYGLVLPPYMEILVVPAGKPQTKPRALNYGLQFARGELVTIYDAEDVPEPLQLRRAAYAFAHLPEYVACLQAELAFHNGNENWLSRGIMAQTPQVIPRFAA